MICSKTKSIGVEIVYCQTLSCFGRLVGVLERCMHFSLKISHFFYPYLCCEMQSCSEMLLNCVVFPTQQAWKYYIALGCD